MKTIKQSKLWFYIPFAILKMRNVKLITNWVNEPNNYRESVKRNTLMECIVWLNFLYCIIIVKLILIILNKLI